jgi:MipA family protein
MNNLFKISFVCLAILTLFSVSLQAVNESDRKNMDNKEWKYEVGAGAMYGPEYEGSDNFGITPLPQLSVEYKEGLFFASIWDGIGSYFLQDDNYKIGASIGFDMGRNEDDDKENLRGMGDIDMKAVFDLMGEYSFGPFNISGKVSKGDSDYGLKASVDFGTMFSVTEQLMAMVSISSTWADAKHMQTFFGVSPLQSARSGYNIYNAKAGVKSAGISFGLIYNMSENWEIMFMASGDKLLGNAKDSPLTKKDFQPSVFVTTSYKF